jgi:hypothetical protein
MEYDPYLDKSLGEEQLSKLKDDAQANIIFARQDYMIKDGISTNLDTKKCYLYLSASEEFLELADKKLKVSLKSIARADTETEAKVISIIETEMSDSDAGLGLIFG